MKEPTYQPRSDSNNAICPYCGCAYRIDAEDYAPDGRVEECEECGRSYFLETTFEVAHTTIPNCELIGIEHDWEAVVPRTLHLDNGQEYKICRSCGKASIQDKGGL